MAAPTYELGPHVFKTRQIAKTYISTEILNAKGYMLGTPITNPEHIEIIEDILSRKENAAEKIGTGIEYFFVDLTSKYKDDFYIKKDARTIAVHRTSGPDVDLGYTKVIDGAGEAEYAKDALRQAVVDLRDRFKFSHFGGQVPAYDEFTGDEIENPDEAEVRYVDPTWGKLTADFAEIEGGWSAIETHSGEGEGQVGRKLVSQDVTDRWRDYYAAHANPVLRRKRWR